MSLRSLLVPRKDLVAKRPTRAEVNLTRPQVSSAVMPAVAAIGALCLAVALDTWFIRLAWTIVAVGASALAIMRGTQLRRSPEQRLYAEDHRLVWASTDTAMWWDDVLATSAIPTGAHWWQPNAPRLYVDFFVTDDAVPDELRSFVVDLDPPAPDLPRTRIRFAVPGFSKQAALNMLRWFTPHLLIDPSTGGSVLFLEPDGDPWPDSLGDTPGGREVPIPPGPILALPAASTPVTEWAPPTAPTDWAPPTDRQPPTDWQPPSAATTTVPLRSRPPYVDVFGHLGRVSGAGVAWRVGWLVARLLLAFALVMTAVLGIIGGLLPPDPSPPVVVVCSILLLWFGILLLRYGSRLAGLTDRAQNFVALTPGGVRFVDSSSYASIPWHVINQGMLSRFGSRYQLCLAVSAHVPMDVSWAVLRAPASSQVLPGQSVLRVSLPSGVADAERLGRAFAAANVPFAADRWPSSG